MSQSGLFCYDTLAHASAKLSNDSQLGSLPLLTTFLKSYARPYLGISPTPATKQQGTAASGEAATQQAAQVDEQEQEVVKEEDELIEAEVRDKFKRMCEGYYDNVAKKLVREHDVRWRL